jgi:serine/threonine protein kinase
MVNLPLAAGSVIANRFEIDRPAGSGGMGTVYRAKDRYTRDFVALKLLHGGSEGVDEAQRFMREAQLLCELRHPGIVSHVAHGQTPSGQRYLAMTSAASFTGTLSQATSF